MRSSEDICMATRFIQRRWQRLMLPLFSLIAGTAVAVSAPDPSPQMVIIDTDIGDDIDDAFAAGLALASPELKILGITSAWGDTALRARLLDRLLCDTGRSDIPVAVGIEKHGPGQAAFSQSRWASRQPARPHPAAVDFLLEQIGQHPGEITLIAIAPLTNLGAAAERDPDAFRKLKRIVMMGGSIHRGYIDADAPNHGPDVEYNIAMDIAAARAVFGSGVPLYVMPLDATQHKLDEAKRQLLFTASTTLTDDLALLYLQWDSVSRRRFCTTAWPWPLRSIPRCAQYRRCGSRWTRRASRGRFRGRRTASSVSVRIPRGSSVSTCLG
jgi:inosine-uridine nucleoside N-ribohydrolase